MSKSNNVNLNVNLVDKTNLNSISVFRDNLFPESVEYNPKTEQFLLSSLTEGTIFTTNEDGSVTPFVEDERLISTVGLAIDEEQDRLYVANSDLGVSINSSTETENQLAALGIFELSTGKLVDYVDLSSLRPGEPHFANDIDVDDKGNAYITDSFSPIIYKVDPEGNPSILLENDQFAGEGFNLNGIVVHPHNFLIVSDFNDGLLYKVPLDNPEQFTQVQLEPTLVNADGLLLADKDELIVITNKFNDLSSNQVFNLQSHDNWESAEIVEKLDVGDDAFTTTATTQDEEILVLDAQIDILLAGETTNKFEILTVGEFNSQMTTFIVDNTDDHGPGSLRQAIEDANATPGTDTIRFNPDLSGQKIILTGGELRISDSVRIHGLLSADDLTIIGNNTSRIFSIDDFDAENQVKVVIDKLTLTEGHSGEGGGVIANSENLTISQSKIVNNQNTSQNPTDGGGAIRNSDTGNLTIDHSLISHNLSNAFGGGITNFGELDVHHSIISHNQVTGGGGAGIDNRGSQADITGSLISYNTNTVGPAGGFGNGTSQTTTVVKNTAILGNQAVDGAGFFVNAGNVKIINSFVNNNQAQNNGGGAGVAADGNLKVKNSLISSNSAEVNGGGIANSGGSVKLIRSLVVGNEALTGNGGGILNEDGFLDLDSSLAFANTPNNVIEV